MTALQVGDERAEMRLVEATKIAPEEPAVWANLGLVRLRRGDYEAAARDLEKARTLAPRSSKIEVMLGLLESRRGRFSEAVSHLRRAVEIDPTNLRTLYSLAEEVERQGGPQAQAERGASARPDTQAQPENPAALLERTRLAAKSGDTQTLRRMIPGWASCSPRGRPKPGRISPVSPRRRTIWPRRYPRRLLSNVLKRAPSPGQPRRAPVRRG